MRKFGLFAVLFCILLAVTALVIGCRIPSDGSDLSLSTDKSAIPDMGSVKLTVNGGSLSRAVLPDSPALSDFTHFTLTFNNGVGNYYFTRTYAQFIASNGNVFDLPAPAGTAVYSLTVVAHMDTSGGGIPNAPAARGTTAGVIIIKDTQTPVTVALEAYDPSGSTGDGYFTYEIDLTGITPLGYGWDYDYSGTIAVFDKSTAVKKEEKRLRNRAVNNNFDEPITLPAGYYDVVITLSKGVSKIVHREVLHIYQNMTSHLQKITFTNDDFQKMGFPLKEVWIHAGEFDMGSPETEYGRSGHTYYYGEDYEVLHRVILTKGFYMSQYTITQAQYDEIMGTNYNVIGDSNWIGANRPVWGMNWYECLIFCNKLSIKDDLSPAYRISGETDPDLWGEVPKGWFVGDVLETNGVPEGPWMAVEIVDGSKGYRLPTEAQWEYACRAGTQTAYYTGDTISDNTGWYNGSGWTGLHEVGELPPNAFGLYDMHGNVFEWCWDRYAPYPDGDPQTDPTGPLTETYRHTVRGGMFNTSSPVTLRSAYRMFGWNSAYPYDYGIRVVRPE